jgi:hypothetical protein
MDDFTFNHAWELEGEYNWKAMVDNYNEVREPQPLRPLATNGLPYDFSAIIARRHTQVFWRPQSWTRTMSRV